MMSSNDYVSVTRGISIRRGKYENLIMDTLMKFKADNFHQAAYFRDCAYETSTGLYDHFANKDGKIDWMKLVEHKPTEEVWKVGPYALLLKNWWDYFSSKMSLKDYLQADSLTIEILRSYAEIDMKANLANAGALESQLNQLTKETKRPL